MDKNKIATRLFGILVILFRSNVALGAFQSDFEAKFRMTTKNLQTSVSQWIGKDTCLRASRLNKMAIIFEIHEGDIIFSANQGDSSMKDEDLQAKEIKDAYELEYSEEVAAFQINEKCTRMISIH